MIDLKDFEKVDIRVGTIVESTFNDKSNKPSIILIVDFGSMIGLKNITFMLKKLQQDKTKETSPCSQKTPNKIGKKL